MTGFIYSNQYSNDSKDSNIESQGTTPPKEKPEQISSTLGISDLISTDGEYLEKYQEGQRILAALNKYFKDNPESRRLKSANITRQGDRIVVSNWRFNYLFKQKENGTLEGVPICTNKVDTTHQIQTMEQLGDYFRVTIAEMDGKNIKQDPQGKDIFSQYMIDKDGNYVPQGVPPTEKGYWGYNKSLQYYSHTTTEIAPYTGKKTTTTTYYNAKMEKIAEDVVHNDSPKYEPCYVQDNSIILSKRESPADIYKIFENGKAVAEGNEKQVKENHIFQEYQEKQKEEQEKRPKEQSFEEKFTSLTKGCTLEISENDKTVSISNTNGQPLYTLSNLTYFDKSTPGQIEFYISNKSPVTLDFSSPVLLIKDPNEGEKGQIGYHLINTQTGKKYDTIKQDGFGIFRQGNCFKEFFSDNEAKILNENFEELGKNPYFYCDNPIVHKDRKTYLVSPKLGMIITEIQGDIKEKYQDPQHLGTFYYIVDIPQGATTKEAQVKIER